MNFVVFVKSEVGECSQILVSPFIEGVRQLAKHSPHLCTIISYHATEGQAQLAARTVPLEAYARAPQGRRPRSRQRYAEFERSAAPVRGAALPTADDSAFEAALQDPIRKPRSNRVNISATAAKHSLSPWHLGRWMKRRGLS